MAGKYLFCKGKECPTRIIPLGPEAPYCVHCGTKNPEFVEKLFMEEFEKPSAQFRSENCTIDGHINSAVELIAEKECQYFCFACGECLVLHGNLAKHLALKKHIQISDTERARL